MGFVFIGILALALLLARREYLRLRESESPWAIPAAVLVFVITSLGLAFGTLIVSAPFWFHR